MNTIRSSEVGRELYNLSLTFGTLSRDLYLRKEVLSAFELVIGPAIRKDKPVLAFGNGGSMADAQHFVAELVGRFGVAERNPIKASTIGAEPASMTAMCNDYSYETAVERDTEAHCVPGSALIVISTSGQSKSCAHAAEAAIHSGSKVIALTGPRMPVFPYSIWVQVLAARTPDIQTVHGAILHIWAKWAEDLVCQN